MRQFFKMFFATLLSLIVFGVLVVLFVVGIISAVAGSVGSEKPDTGSNGVLYIDTNAGIQEQVQSNPLASLNGKDEYDMPGLYDLVRVIRYAKSDSTIKGIYLKCGENGNGFATSESLRSALLDFKTSHKFIYAYADVISQKAYYIANVADSIFCNPKGGLEWKGFSLQYMFFKQALDKLSIEPEIFYAGKFKSATEPFRTDHMTVANSLQSSVFLNDLYQLFLRETSAARHVDTGILHRYANEYAVQSAGDAVRYKLIDGTRYDDEVKTLIRKSAGVRDQADINFIPIAKYARARTYKKTEGEKIALIFAQGDIVDGKGDKGQIGGDTYRSLIQTAAQDNSIRAIVIRVNSGGGSAMASENIWRAVKMARQRKPVVMSFGDYAASGGYYMSCGADSIFTEPNTLTGSIGVFSIIPNFGRFFSDKLGITFDGVKTGPFADVPTATRELTETEKRFLQNDVDSIYDTFIHRVSAGRKINPALVDSIGQGRVWTGERAILIGLADRTGSLQDALDCAARMAKVRQYRLKEYPEPLNWWESIFGGYKKTIATRAMEQELGVTGARIYQTLKGIQSSAGSAQAKLPFTFSIR